MPIRGELFFELSHRCRTGVRHMPDGRRPFDVQIPLIIDSPQFRYLLMPLPGGRLRSLSPRATVGVVMAPTPRSVLPWNSRTRISGRRSSGSKRPRTERPIRHRPAEGVAARAGARGRARVVLPKSLRVWSARISRLRTASLFVLLITYRMAVTRPRQAVGASVVSTCVPNRNARRIIASSSIPKPKADQ